jgi:GntR family transcriptional regulator/MocR family aminotransferase
MIYRELASEIRQKLRLGHLRSGDRLPSTRQWAEERGVHRHTVMAAYEELMAEGWVESHPGQGYQIAGEWVARASQAPAEQPFDWDFGQELAVAADWERTSAPYRFPSGQPDLRVFPHDEYYAQVRQALRRCPAEELLGYSDPPGRPFFCEQLGHYLRRARGLIFSPQQLVVTHGAQEAVYLVARTWLRPGDVVAVEEQGFSKVWEAFRCTQAQLVPIRVDEGGLCPDSLEAVLKAQKIRLIYTTPLHQYPTTVTLSPQRRQRLYELAQKYQVPILEDDYDYEFHYQGPSQPPLKASDPSGLVIYCGTFSKVLHPSARLGFLIAPPPLAERVALLKTVVSRQNDNLAQEAVAGWIAEGGFERHLRRMRRVYARRRALMAKALQGWTQFALPDGGMCIWADLGVDTASLARRALREGVEVRPGRSYRLDGLPSTCLRLGFAYPNESEIEEGLARLRSLL